jgi:microsomal epoxide hydrolase
MRRPDNMTDDHLNAFELQGLENLQKFTAFGSGYATEHGTRPSTIGHVVSSSPVALLAW